MSDDIRGCFRKEVLGLRAYEVEEQSGLVKLDANENPFPPPQWLREALAGAAGSLELNRYPDPSALRLRTLLAARTGWDCEGILLGNGSDELISTILTACGQEGARMLVPSPTFAMYRLTGLASGWEVEEYPLNGEFDLEEGAFIDRVRECRPRLVIVAWPNNPTGNCVDEGVLKALLSAAPGLVVIDEAYFEFSDRTFLDRLAGHRNLIILRTLSKIGLAALRLGYLLADPSVAAELNKVRLPYNVSTFSQEGASLVLENTGYLGDEIAAIVSGREDLITGMREITGIRPFPSEANFILFRTAKPSTEIFRGLKEKGVLVRDLGRPGPLENCLRVTVGTEGENRLFLEALAGIAE